MKTVRRERSDEEPFQTHTHVSLHTSSIHSHKWGGKINIYKELLGIVETFAGMFDMRMFLFFYRGFKNERKRQKHFTQVHHCCSLSHNIVKDLYSHRAVETRRWGLFSGTHTQGTMWESGTPGFTSGNLHWPTFFNIKNNNKINTKHEGSRNECKRTREERGRGGD